MAKILISLVVDAQDEPLSGDYQGAVPDAAFIAEYLKGAGEYLIPGVTVEHALAADVSEYTNS